MKKIMNIIAVAVIIAASAIATPSYAQDVRGRSVETVVQDALAAMPVQTRADFNTEMKYLADCAPQTVVILGGMLQSADKGANELIEYALNGLGNYASDPANKACLAKVKEGFEKAAAACADPYNKQFLEFQIRLLGPSTVTEFPEFTSSCTAKEALKALKGDNPKDRVTSLESCTEKLLLNAKLLKKFKSLSNGAKADVLNYAGTFKQKSLLPLVIGAMTNSDSEISSSAIKAASKIGTDDAARALVALAGSRTVDQKVLLEALSSVKADNLESIVVDKIVSTQDTGTLGNLVWFANTKRMSSAAPVIFSLMEKPELQGLASALEGVVRPADADKLAGLLDKSKEPEDINNYVHALVSSLSTLGTQEKFDKALALMNKSFNTEYFYPVIASSNADDAVKFLASKAKEGSANALACLCGVDNKTAIAPLMSFGTDSALQSAIGLLLKYSTNKDDLSVKLSNIIEKAGASVVKANALDALVSAPTMGSFLEAAKYLDDADLKFNASSAVRTIASKTTDDIDYDALVSNLGKARDNYLARGYADDGYAIKEIEKMISESVKPEYVSATPEELAEGFEILFDGSDMDKWEGNLAGYTPVNGNIYVSAVFGDDMNLYTKKEYKDFVLRFDFTFTRAGVNNGIGIRTPEGVDAAYFGMCECQVLDHGDPMYKKLNPYQVHGSVYGLIPAKIIQHKPLGEWSTEEIRVEGDNIKVTVNGEVILDGNIREACQGYNISPDGKEPNPYTADHRNHPGMFNEKGHISFCGHGVGMMYRNVRILDLTARNAADKSKSKKSRKK